MIPKQVYYTVGEAVHLAQVLEFSIRAFVSLMDKSFAQKNGKSKVVIVDEGKTVGQLIEELRSRAGICQDLLKVLMDAFEARDWVVSHFFVRNTEAFITVGTSGSAVVTLTDRAKEIACACGLMDGLLRVQCQALGIKPGELLVRQDEMVSTRFEVPATLDDVCTKLSHVSKTAQPSSIGGSKKANDAYASELLQDCIKTFPHWFGPEEQFWRRTAVRAAFGAIEGWCSWVRAEIRPMLDAIKAAGLLAPDEGRKADELLLATDRHETVLDDKGLPKKQKRKTTFNSMFRATVRLYSIGRAVGSGFVDAHFSKDGWNQLRTAVKVRDRVTHPHEADDIVVSQDDLHAVRAGMNWYIEMVQTIDAEHIRVLNYLNEVLKAREQQM